MYFNSCIPWNQNEPTFLASLNLVYRCGYQGAFINLKNLGEYQTFIKSPYFLHSRPDFNLPLSVADLTRFKTESSPLILFPRVTLEPSNSQNLKKELSHWISKRCIIAVQSTDKSILEIAARDGRVDMISIPTLNYIKELSKGILSLVKQNRIYLDLHWGELIMSYGNKRTRMMRSYYKLFKEAKPHLFQYIIGTGQGTQRYSLESIRGPREIGAILSSIFEIPEMHSKKMVRDNLEQLSLLFTKRDLGFFIEPGVEIVGKKPKEDV